jgi:hypothetical protein
VRRRRWRWRFTRRLIVGSAVILCIGGAAAAIKLNKKDVEKIEKQTGKKAEEMSEEELKAAMKELGIQSMELTEEDELVIDKAEQEDQSSAEKEKAAQPAASTSASSASEKSDYATELRQLAELHEQGILTDEEYEAKKKQVLGL